MQGSSTGTLDAGQLLTFYASFNGIAREEDVPAETARAIRILSEKGRAADDKAKAAEAEEKRKAEKRKKLAREALKKMTAGLGRADARGVADLIGSDAESDDTDEETDAGKAEAYRRRKEAAAVAARPVSFLWPTADGVARLPLPQRQLKANLSFYEKRGVPFERNRDWPKGALAVYEPHADRQYPPHSKIWLVAPPAPAQARAGIGASAGVGADRIMLRQVRDQAFIGSANPTQSAFGSSCHEAKELRVANWEAGALFAPVVALTLPADVAPYVLDASPAGAATAQALEEHLGLHGLAALRAAVVGGGFTRLRGAPRPFELAFRLPPRPFSPGDVPFRMSDEEKRAVVQDRAQEGEGEEEAGDDGDDDGSDEERGGGGGWSARGGGGDVADYDDVLVRLAQAASAAGFDPGAVVSIVQSGIDPHELLAQLQQGAGAGAGADAGPAGRRTGAGAGAGGAGGRW